jgi:hypothetical protein
MVICREIKMVGLTGFEPAMEVFNTLWIKSPRFSATQLTAPKMVGVAGFEPAM